MAKVLKQTITDPYARRIAFKKRRMGLIKKAMALQSISGCQISLKIFSPDDSSLIEYITNNCERFINVTNS